MHRFIRLGRQKGMGAEFRSLNRLQEPSRARRTLRALAALARRLRRLDGTSISPSPHHLIASPLDYARPLLHFWDTCPQSIWPNLAFCAQFAACRVLTAMMAFAWLGWIVLVGLIILAILAAVSKVRPARAPMMVEWAAPAHMARSVTV